MPAGYLPLVLSHIQAGASFHEAPDQQGRDEAQGFDPSRTLPKQDIGEYRVLERLKVLLRHALVLADGEELSWRDRAPPSARG